MDRLAYTNTGSNLPWSKFSSTEHKSGHVLVYCDFNLQKWCEASSLPLISNLKATCFTEVCFQVKIMGKPLKKYFQIF